MNEELLLKNGIIFDSKPDAVPYNYRISYMVSLLCLIIHICCGKRKGCSLIKMNMISVGLSSRREGQKLKEFCEANESRYMLVRFDPVVNRALAYAINDGLMTQQGNGLFKLTDKGKKMVEMISMDESILLNEKVFLKNISMKITEEKIESLMHGWRNMYVED